jgi:2-C-methyl-D-erythritol 2,4-cyclodiphosphate synthase
MPKLDNPFNHPAPGGPTLNWPQMRVGEGWDVHALVEGRPLVLGGVTIPHNFGLLGHSDADALLHAITDALLGAAGLGDIGHHFPDTDSAYEGADSVLLLQAAAHSVRSQGWQIVNIDSTVVAQAPKLAPFIPAMRQRVSLALGLAPDLVNIKAKTAEKMGPVGEYRAIEARAVCLLMK